MKRLLQLMQLSDSAVPIGAAAHSFGLEGLAEAGGVSAESLLEFTETYLEEQGLLEACFCRASYRCALRGEGAAELCFALSALKPARESREGSIVLSPATTLYLSTSGVIFQRRWREVTAIEGRRPYPALRSPQCSYAHAHFVS